MKHSTFLIPIVLAALCPALAGAKEACSKAELKRLKASVGKIAAGRRAPEAWRVASIMLCGEGRDDELFLLGRMAERMTSKSFHTGDKEETTETVTPSPSLMLRRRASEAQAKPELEAIEVSWRDEACAGSFSLRFRESKWIIDAVSTACD